MLLQKIKKILYSEHFILKALIFGLVFFCFIVIPLYIGLKGNFITGYGDTQQFIWQAKNLRNVIVHRSTMINDSFFMVETPYAYTPISGLQSILFLLLKFFLNNTYLAYNLTHGIFLLLNFFSMYYVLLKWGKTLQTRLIFSFIFAFLPSTLLHTNHISLFIVFTIPLFIYFLFKVKDDSSVKNFLLISFIYSLTFYIHEYYGFMLTIIGLLFLLFYYKDIFKTENIKPLIISIFFIIVMMVPFIKLNIDKIKFDKQNNIITSRSIDEAYFYSANPMNYIVPPNDSYLYNSIRPYIYSNQVPVEHTNYAGIINIILLITTFFLIYNKKILITKKIIFVFVSFVIGLILSFGPYIVINGGRQFLPVAIGFKLDVSIFETIRAYARFGILTLTIIIITTAFTYDLLGKKNKLFFNPFIVFFIIIFSLFDLFPFKTLPKSAISVPEEINIIKEDKDYNAMVAHIPFLTNSFSYNTTAMTFQTSHHHPIINGYASFVNPNWEKKIIGSSVKCFHFSYHSLPECNSITAADFKKENIKYIVYEKKDNDLVPGLLSGYSIPDVRTKVFTLAEKLGSVKVILDDENYKIYQLY